MYYFQQKLFKWTISIVFKRVRITPIYKSRDKDNMIEYRPISVLSNFSKLIEKLTHV